MMGRSEAAMRHWRELSQDDQRAVIREMAAKGFSDHMIAQATQLSVEMVCQVLGHLRRNDA